MGWECGTESTQSNDPTLSSGYVDYADYLWDVTDDTLCLTWLYQSSKCFVLAREYTPPPPPPNIMGEWQYAEWRVDGVDRDLADFYEVTQTNTAKLFFVNSETYDFDWWYEETTVFQQVVQTNYSHNGCGSFEQADSLQLTITHRNNGELPTPIILPRYHAAIEQETNLMLTYIDQGSINEFRLLRIEE